MQICGAVHSLLVRHGTHQPYSGEATLDWQSGNALFGSQADEVVQFTTQAPLLYASVLQTSPLGQSVAAAQPQAPALALAGISQTGASPPQLVLSAHWQVRKGPQVIPVGQSVS